MVGSFFVCGEHLTEETKPILKRAYRMGCEIDNHSYSHSNMTELSKEDILSEIDRTSRIVFETIGKYPKFFRPPYIAINQSMFDVINLPFICGYGCNDWNSNVSVKERIDGILKQAEDGCIILLHDLYGNDKTVQALDVVIPKLKSLNFELVTVSQLFTLKGIIPTVHKNMLYTNVMNPKVCTW